MGFENASVEDVIKAFANKDSGYPLTYEYCNKFMQEEGGYISLAGTFLGKGDMGKRDDRLFYQWIVSHFEEESLIEKSTVINTLKGVMKEDCKEFVFSIKDTFNYCEKRRPNQKWHCLISYLAFKEFTTTQIYKDNLEKGWLKPIKLDEKPFLESKVSNYLKCRELKLWIMEAIKGTDAIKVTDALIEKINLKNKREADDIIDSLWKNTIITIGDSGISFRQLRI